MTIANYEKARLIEVRNSIKNTWTTLSLSQKFKLGACAFLRLIDDPVLKTFPFRLIKVASSRPPILIVDPGNMIGGLVN